LANDTHVTVFEIFDFGNTTTMCRSDVVVGISNSMPSFCALRGDVGITPYRNRFIMQHRRGRCPHRPEIIMLYDNIVGNELVVESKTMFWQTTPM